MAAPLKILLVEDENELREMLSVRLQTFGYEVVEAASGDEAWAKFQKQQVSVVITDIRMNNGSGLDLLKKIRQKNYKFPSVFVVSGFFDLSIENILAEGAEGFFPKPFSASVLRDIIRKSQTQTDQRWTIETTLPMVESLQEDFTAQSEDQVTHLFGMGRGGFFIKCKACELGTGDNIEFQINTEEFGLLIGQGHSWWSHPKQDGTTLLGVEILYLQEPSRQKVLDWIDHHKPIPWIPLSPQS